MGRSWARRCQRFARRSCAPATCSVDLGRGCSRRRRFLGWVADRRAVAPLQRAGAVIEHHQPRERPALARRRCPAPVGRARFPFCLRPGPRALPWVRAPARQTQRRPSPRQRAPRRRAQLKQRPQLRVGRPAVGQLRAARPRQEPRSRLRRAAMSAAAEFDRPSLPSKGRKPSSPPATRGERTTIEGRSRSFASSLAGEPPTAERAAGAVEPGTAPPTAPAAATANDWRPPCPTCASSSPPGRTGRPTTPPDPRPRERHHQGQPRADQ
jgi:hypothetical protein